MDTVCNLCGAIMVRANGKEFCPNQCFVTRGPSGPEGEKPGFSYSPPTGYFPTGYTPEAIEEMQHKLNDGLNSGAIRSEVQRDSSGRVIGCSFVSVPQSQAKVDWPSPIPVNERLPEAGSRCLVFGELWGKPPIDWETAEYTKGGSFIGFGGHSVLNVTHWLALPTKPG